MKIHYDKNEAGVVSALLSGGVVVLRTDTLYGIVARADDQSAVERVYAIKGRNPHKSCIVLIADSKMLYDLPDDLAALELIEQKWPGPVSIILPSPSAPDWLLRTDQTLAYRCPDDPELRRLIAQTGPLIAPSANPEGLAPAHTIDQAIVYFGDMVDGYVDSGEVPSDMPPSQLIKIDPKSGITRLR